MDIPTYYNISSNKIIKITLDFIILLYFIFYYLEIKLDYSIVNNVNIYK